MSTRFSAASASIAGPKYTPSATWPSCFSTSSAARSGRGIKVGQALHFESGGSTEGLAMFDAWCATCHDKWSFGWCENKWRSFRRGGITGGTIFALAEEHSYARRQERNFDFAAKANGTKAGNGANGSWSHRGDRASSASHLVPHSIEAEQALLGAILTHNEVHGHVCD